MRNHLPVPEVDLKTFALELNVEETTKKTLSFEDIKKYPKYTITSAIMCGGNRRSEMAEVNSLAFDRHDQQRLQHDHIIATFLQEKQLKGLSWGVGAVGNATWTGARLCDVLKDLGIKEEDYNHVQVLLCE